jgi:glycerophosphoryl diester phosphodiesterase
MDSRPRVPSWGDQDDHSTMEFQPQQQGVRVMNRQNRFIFGMTLVFFHGMLNASTLIFAHRGASSVAPENTLASFSKAVEFGADCFELDVTTSLDDSLMIIHDETLDRTTDGSGSVGSMSYSQLRGFDAGSWFGAEFTGVKIPTLAEALKLALASPYRVGVVVEIKGNAPTIVEKVIADVKKYDMQDRVIISSFAFDHLVQSKAIDSSIPVQLFGTITQENIDQMAGIGGEWVGTDGAIDEALLRSVRAKNMKLNKWTVDSAGEMGSLARMGVDAITTNFPQTARSVMDGSPPADVVLNEPVVSSTQVKLTWAPAQDPESGVVGYVIYRDPAPDARTFLAAVHDTTAFVDETRREAKTFYYRIKAQNGAGLTSLHFSNEVSATTESDRQAPRVSSVSSFGPTTDLIVEFDEAVDPTSAENTVNYRINNQILVDHARLSLDSTSVLLTTSAMSDDTDYILSIADIADAAAVPNAIEHPIDVSFRHHPFLPQTVASWDFNEGEGDIFSDQTGNSNAGALHNGLSWSKGQTANGLFLDGIDDYAVIPASASLDINGSAVTVSLWTRLALLPGDLPGAYGPIYDSDDDNYVLYEDRSSKELRFKVTTSNGAERPGIPEIDLRPDEWLHIVGVYNGSTIKIYLNGKMKDVHLLTGTVKPGQVAKLGTSAGSYFKGSIDNIQVFNRALSQAEINFLYQDVKITTGVNPHPSLPDYYSLSQNYPNPFNPTTTLNYTVTQGGLITLSVYDVLGRKVTDLLHQRLNPGSYRVTWDGTDASGLPVASGVYFLKISSLNFTALKKMTLTR